LHENTLKACFDAPLAEKLSPANVFRQGVSVKTSGQLSLILYQTLQADWDFPVGQ